MGDDYKLSDIAAALEVPLARLRTMRARGQTATWDTGDGEDTDPGATRRYSVLDAVSLALVLELMGRGLAADAAARIVTNCRRFIYDGPHPDTASADDVWIGRLSYEEGATHVGGPLPSVMFDIHGRVRDRIRNAPKGEGGASGAILANASATRRRVMEGLRHVGS